MKRAPLSRGAYRCLKAVKSYDFQKRGWSCPSHNTLSKDLSVSTRQIKRYIAELTKKSYVFPRRRPNSSSLYHFGYGKPQNVPTVGTENVPAGVPADVPTIQLVLKHHNGTPATLTKKPPAKEHRTIMEMPTYYTNATDQKLWRMAARWIIQNNPDLGAYTADRCAPIMEQLERAGAANLPEDAPLPAISWPPADLPKIAQPSRKPAASADLLRLAASVKSQIG